MGVFDAKALVYIDSSLATHIAMAVPPDITAGDLKRKLESEHSIYFPNVGEIRITGLMVKRRSHYYHLPDSIPIKSVFEELEQNWFLLMDVTPLSDDKTCESEGLIAECRVSASSHSDAIKSKRPGNHITCTDKISSGNEAEKGKRERSFDDLGEKLQKPVNSTKKKKKRKTKKGFIETVDENEGFSVTEGSPCLPLQEPTNCSESMRAIDYKGQMSQPTIQTLMRISASSHSDDIKSKRPGNHITCTDKISSGNEDGKRKRARSFDDLGEKFQKSVNVTKKKKKRKTKKGFIETVDENREGFSVTEGSPCLPLQEPSNCSESMIAIDFKGQMSQPTVQTPMRVSASSHSDDIKSKRPGNHITCTDKINSGNESGKRKRERSFDDLGEKLQKPVNVTNKKKKRKTKKGFVETVDDYKEGFSVTEGSPCLPLQEPSNCSESMRAINHKGQMSQPTIQTPMRISASSHRDDIKSKGPLNHITGTDKISSGHEAGKRKRERSFGDLGEKLQKPVKVTNKKKRKTKKGFIETVDKNKEGFSVAEGSPCLPLQESSNCNESMRTVDYKGQMSQSTIQTPSVSLSEVVSVSGIMTRYFPEFVEVRSFDCPSRCDVKDKFRVSVSHWCHQDRPLKTETNELHSKVLVQNTSKSAAKSLPTLPLPPPAKTTPETSRLKLGRTEVGKRFVTAVNDLGICTSKKSFAEFQSKSGKKSQSIVRNLVYELSDSDKSSRCGEPAVC